MKKICMLLMVVMCATMFTACSKDDEAEPFGAGEGVITMTTKKEKVVLYVETAKVDVITINWGDGNVEEFKTIADMMDDGEMYYMEEPEHIYENNKSHTITVEGELTWLDCGDNKITSLNVTKCTALTWLECAGNNLTALDISKNTALINLQCRENHLTSLDVSKNTALIWLDCEDNNFSVSAMNAIYNALPVVNNGELFCDKIGDYSVAENKGWYVE